MTYGDLYEHLYVRLSDEDGAISCDNTLRNAQHFAEEHNLFAGEFLQYLHDFGGHCDCEVLLNVACRVPDGQVINAETIPSPRRIAIDNGWWVHCTVDGVSSRLMDTVAAREEGRGRVAFWVPCDKSEKYASPNLTRAYEWLYERGLLKPIEYPADGE